MVKKKVAKKREKVEIKSRRVKGVAVVARIDDEPVVEIDKLSTVSKKNKITVFVSSDLTARKPEKTIRAHGTESEAIGRFSRRFPQITPRLRKRL